MCAGSCHGYIDSEFINEDQIISLHRILSFFEISALFRIGFGRKLGLFLKTVQVLADYDRLC